MMRVGLAMVLVIAAAIAPTHAAVRICGAAIAVGPFSAASELEAKKLALDAWKAEAAKLGERYAGWGTAIDRMLTCSNAEARQDKQKSIVTCTATATPCTIEQAPNTLENRSKRLGI